jgi:hypothetical protein
MKKVLSKAVLLGGLLAGVFVLTAAAEEFLFRSAIAGSNPNISIGGVPSGGAPWVVQQGSAALQANGKLHVEVAGLILPKPLEQSRTSAPVWFAAVQVEP